MESGVLESGVGEWERRVESGVWRVESGVWRVERVESGVWRVECGVCQSGEWSVPEWSGVAADLALCPLSPLQDSGANTILQDIASSPTEYPEIPGRSEYLVPLTFPISYLEHVHGNMNLF